MKYILLEHHPHDSRVRIVEDDICQSLSARMGTGGGNVPILIQIDDGEVDRIRSSDARGNGDGKVCCSIVGGHQTSISDYTAIVLTFSKQRRAQSAEDYETWIESDKANTINTFDMGDVRATTLVINERTDSFGIESESRNDNE